MNQVIYHLETHRQPRQVERLAATLLRLAPDCLVVINHDERSEPLDVWALDRLGVVVQYATGGYSDMSHARRWLQTVRWLRAEGVQYEWLSNLSGQDYPVRPLEQVHADLADTTADAFMETFDVFDPEQTPWGISRGTTRYRFRHTRLGRLSHQQKVVLRPLQVVNRVQPWVRLTTATGLTVGRRVDAPWGRDIQLFGGSFFTTLRRSAVDEVLAFVKGRPEIVSFLDGALAPAEVFFQTALGGATELRIENDCRRYFDFAQTKFNHSRTLTREDLPAVFASGKDFARKFDLSVDPRSLDLVDSHLERVAAGAVG